MSRKQMRTKVLNHNGEEDPLDSSIASTGINRVPLVHSTNLLCSAQLNVLINLKS